MDVPSEIATLQNQLQQTQLACAMAREMSEFKAGFLARVSHELRSPLSSLLGLHELILSDLCEDADEEREFVGQAKKSATKLMAMIDEVVSVSKMEYGTSQLDLQPLSLSYIFQQVETVTHLQAANRNLRLKITPPTPDIYVLGDPRRLNQVFVHLVDSAIRHTSQGRITLSTATSETEQTQIWFDLDCASEAWSEPIDLLQQEIVAPAEIQWSSGMNLLIDQMLLTGMGGKLEGVAPLESEGYQMRLQITIPSIVPEFE